MMKIKKAKGVQHSVVGYVCACVMSGCSCSSHCDCVCKDTSVSASDSNSTSSTSANGAMNSSTYSVQNGSER